MFYKKGIDITNDKQMFEFLKGHYEYFTLSSWNLLKSIANCVKVHKLNLEGDEWNALAFLQDEDYYEVNMMIREWERLHKGYKVGFNGRSGGYLVLYNEKDNRTILPAIIDDNDTYEEYKEDCKYYYGSVKAARSDLVFYTKLVQDFDKLCDELRDYVNDLSLMDFKEQKLIELVENFNDTYSVDLKNLNIEQLKVDDGKVNVQEIYLKSLALWKLFYGMMNRYGDYGYRVEIDNGLAWLED